MTLRPTVRALSTRAPTRAIVFWAAYLTIVLAAQNLPPVLPSRWTSFGVGFASSVVLLLVTRAMLRRDGRTLADAGIGFDRRSVPRFLLGAVLGVATYALNVGVIAIAVGGLRLIPLPTIDWGDVALTLTTLLALSCMEELGFRGYPLRELVRELGAWPAQTLVAVAFAMAHLVYGWTWQTVVFGVFPSAFMFGAAALVSGGLAMPIGLHMAVNAARWALGESGTTGFFRMMIEPSAGAGIERVAPVSGIAITLGMAGMLWWWQRASLSGNVRAPR